MGKTYLITGASGFVGTHLVEYLLEVEPGCRIVGTSFAARDEYLSDLLPDDHIEELNLLDREKVLSLVERVKPDYVVHLAALSSPARSFDEPGETINNNVQAQINLMDGLVKADRLVPTLIIGSADEYGRVDEEDVPIDENVELRPVSPYAVSKITQDFLGLQYYYTYKLPVVRLRPFNHTGERQAPIFVVPAFAKQVAEIEAGKMEPVMRVGNLEAVRDFTDVKDMVRAYYLALQSGEPGEVYNLGSGKGVAIKEMLEMLLSMSEVEIKVETDPEKFRPVDEPVLVCDMSKFGMKTRFETKIEFRETLERVLNYWRDEVKK